MKVRIEQIEWGQWLSRVFRPPCKEPEYDLTIIGHAEAWDIANYANPKYYFRYDSPTFQALFAKSEVTLDDKARRDLYVQMQQLLVEDAPVGVAVHAPAPGRDQEGRDGLWKDLPAGTVLRFLGGRLDAGQVTAGARVRRYVVRRRVAALAATLLLRLRAGLRRRSRAARRSRRS